MSDDGFDVVAVGSAIVDILVEADAADVAGSGLEPGGMTLVDLATSDALYQMVRPSAQVSGGSAANTAVGVAALGGAVGFMGRTASDAFGALFRRDLAEMGVAVGRSRQPDGESPSGTGRCVVLVTADGERTMATYLGVATMLEPGDIDEAMVAASRVLYLEGYLWDVASAKEALRQAIDVAHRNEVLVALSASDRMCVDRHRRELLDLVGDEIDVLFANEEEAVALFGAPTVEAAVDRAASTGILVAVTRGAAGSVVVTPSGSLSVPAADPGAVVDTTGAGDLYAAGFLYGLTHGADPDQCAALGSVAAAEVLSHLGARPLVDLRPLAAHVGRV